MSPTSVTWNSCLRFDVPSTLGSFFFFSTQNQLHRWHQTYYLNLSNPTPTVNCQHYLNQKQNKKEYSNFIWKTTVSDKKSWDTLTKRCVFPSRAPLVPLKVVYRGLVTKSCTPTLRGQGDPKVSQPFWPVKSNRKFKVSAYFLVKINYLTELAPEPRSNSNNAILFCRGIFLKQTMIAIEVKLLVEIRKIK